VAGASPVPVQMWQGRAQSRCRCGRGEPGPGADAAGVSPVPVQMWQGRARPVQMWLRRARSRCRCGRGEPSPGADVDGTLERRAYASNAEKGCRFQGENRSRKLHQRCGPPRSLPHSLSHRPAPPHPSNQSPHARTHEPVARHGTARHGTIRTPRALQLVAATIFAQWPILQSSVALRAGRSRACSRMPRRVPCWLHCMRRAARGLALWSAAPSAGCAVPSVLRGGAHSARPCDGCAELCHRSLVRTGRHSTLGR
jgi:hypothetical protein